MSGLDQLILFTTDLLALFAVYLIINIGLNLQEGITGIPNFGILFAVAGGAYFTGGLSTRFALSLLGIQTDLSPILNNVTVLALINPTSEIAASDSHRIVDFVPCDWGRSGRGNGPHFLSSCGPT